MELIYYSEQTLPRQSNTAPAAISFNKNGVIVFNASACTKLGLTTDSKVTIAQDKKELKNWYVFIDNDNGFSLGRKDQTKDKTLRFGHKKLYETVLESVGLSIVKTHQFKIGGATVISKTSYWGILIPTK